jgi:mono/diheme cytochrome c family protein
LVLVAKVATKNSGVQRTDLLRRKASFWLGGLVLAGALGLLAFWLVSAPRPLTQAALPEHQADVANGARIYHASGCHSCHLAPDGFAAAAADLPVGGKAFKTPIGILYPPNLTPDPETGLGTWSDLQFVNAMQKGLGRSEEHLIPAFPYTSYAKMKIEDVLDLKAYLASLTPVSNPAKPHDVLALPLVRRGLGAWKWIGFDETKVQDDTSKSLSWNRGRYLVDGPGHCNECHTPRNLFMASDTTRYLAGGPHPDGDGKVPSLHDLMGRGRYKDATDLASAFEFGEVMGYDKMSSGGMGAVQGNLARLPPEDRQAIADYLVSLQ